jgi:hypothetical protein
MDPCQESSRNGSPVGFIEIENPARGKLFQKLLKAK